MTGSWPADHPGGRGDPRAPARTAVLDLDRVRPITVRDSGSRRHESEPAGRMSDDEPWSDDRSWPAETRDTQGAIEVPLAVEISRRIRRTGRRRVLAGGLVVLGLVATGAVVLATGIVDLGGGSVVTLVPGDPTGATATMDEGTPGGGEGAASTAGVDESAAGVETEVVVHVTGAVAVPGVYMLTAGTRVIEAVEAAGGFSDDADVSVVNLAAEVADAQQIRIPRLGEAGAPVPGAPDTTTGLVNINTADAATLETLPRIGAVTAAQIIAWREEHGPFASVAELELVPGIGPRTIELLADLVTT